MLSHLQYLTTTLNIKGEEITKLRKLETFTGSFSELQDFQKYAKYIWDQWPTNYQLVVGSPWSFEHDDLIELFEKPEESYNGINFINCKIGRDLVVLPYDLHALAINKCHNLISLNTISLFHGANDLKICYISECEGIECALDLSLLSCDSLQNIEVLNLKGLCNLCNLCNLVRGVAIVSTSSAPAPPAIFSSLRTFELSNCSRMKKLFSLEILHGFQNLEFLKVESCNQMEKIIALEEDEENHKGEGRCANITTFILPKLRRLVLWELSELRSISSAGVMIHAYSFQYIWIVECPKLKRISLSLPLLENGQPSPPPSLKGIYVKPREWWKSLEWEDPNVMDVLSPFVSCKED
ncbi:hypothetical protein CRYUN_Cryun12cG0115000 [Craigia yunnanensis]